MTIIYVIVGIFVAFLVLIVAVYTAISFALVSKKTPSLDEGQKAKCREAIRSGKARSVACRLYTKKGRCPHQHCSNIE
jgi:hypothetical protein